MAEWWEAAPVVEKPKAAASGNWWDSAPFVGGPQPVTPKAEQVMSSYELGMFEKARNFLRDNHILPVEQMEREARTADDLVRQTANGATFNQADRLAGALQGTGNEAEQAKTAAAAERTGTAGEVANMAGAIAMPMGAAKTGLTLAGKFGADAIKGLPGLLTRAGLMGAEGAGYGAATAAGNGEDIGEGAKMGLAFGAGGNILGEGIGAVVNKIWPKSATPEIDAMRAAKEAAYDDADKLGVRYSPQGFQRYVSDVIQGAMKSNISKIRHPKAADMVETLVGYGKNGASPTLTEMDQLQQVIRRDLANSGDEAEAHFGQMMIKKLDDFLDGAGGQDVIAGSGADASAAIKKARELNRRYRNAQTLEEAGVKAERRAASTDSGGNEENAKRQNLRRILDDPNKAKFLNAEEKDALETAVRGSQGQNAARWAGKKLTGIQGLTVASGMGLASLNPLGAAVPLGAALVGSGLKGLSRSIGNDNMTIAEHLIRTGKRPQNAMSPAQIDVLSRILMGGGVGGGTQLLPGQ